MVRQENDSTIIASLAVVATAMGWFLYRVWKEKRIIEFLISTPAVIGSYYLISNIEGWKPLWLLLAPAIAYIGYWWFLFKYGKVLPFRSEVHWDDEDWWWALDGWEFEEEVAKVFRRNGFRAEVTRKTGDGGVDIIMYKNKRKIIVQCKHYTSPVAPEVARALWGVREDFNADEVYLVASSGISSSTEEFVRNKRNFKVLDLYEVMCMACCATHDSKK